MKKLLVVVIVLSSLVIVGSAVAGPIDWLMELVGYSPTSQLISAKAEISRLNELVVFLTRVNWVGVGIIALLVITGEVIRRWFCSILRKVFKKEPILDPAVKAAFEAFQAEAIASAKAAKAATAKIKKS